METITTMDLARRWFRSELFDVCSFLTSQPHRPVFFAATEIGERTHICPIAGIHWNRSTAV